MHPSVHQKQEPNRVIESLDQNTDLRNLQPLDSKESNIELYLIIKEEKKLINGKSFHFFKARLINQNKLSVTINNIEYFYNATKEYKNKKYFQCVGRKRQEQNGKCLAKANYDLETNILQIIDLHNQRCQKVELDVNHDYQSQKEDIINELMQNDRLTVKDALDLLREKISKHLLAAKDILLNMSKPEKF